MALPNFILEAKNLFAQGKTEACLDLLLARIEDKKLYYEVLDLKRRINALESKEARGLINQEDATLEHNQISNGLLMILQKIDTRGSDTPESGLPVTQPRSPLGGGGRSRLFIALGILAAVLVGVLLWRLGSDRSGPQQEGAVPAEQSEPDAAWDERERPASPGRESASPAEGEGGSSREKPKSGSGTDRAAADEEAFRTARRTNTLRAYYDYIKTFPDGRYVSEVKKRIAQLEEGEKDKKAFEAARRRNTAAAYQAYLRTFPQGAYAGEARKRLDELKKEKEDSGSGICRDCARVRSFNVSHQTDDMMVIDVRYYYDGSRGEPAFVSTVMANDGKALTYYAHNPGRIYRGNKVTRCTLRVSDSAPATFSSNQIRFSFYGGEDRSTFHQEFKDYRKTWKK